MHTAALLLGGLVGLVGGAELLVRGASRLALSFGLSPLLVGLTVVAWGTSAPELAVSVGAALQGSPSVALGNVVGSNIANLLVILGVSALAGPLVVSRQLVRLDLPAMLGATAVVVIFCGDGQVSRPEGVVLAVGMVLYTMLTVRAAKQYQPLESPTDEATGPAWVAVLQVLGGLLILVKGATWFVTGAVLVARAAGLSELVIGLTVVAVGTSLPELATSVMAAVRGQRDLAVGNAIGSNLGNLLAVLGVAAIAGGGIAVPDAALWFDLPVMLAVSIAALPVCYTGHLVSRSEGALALCYYVAYTTYLVLAAERHDSLHAFSRAMAWFVIPLTVAALGVGLYRELRARLRGSAARPE